MAKYVYLDQSTISRLSNANDSVTASVSTLSNHADFVIVLSFEHIIESAALGEQKKVAISQFLNSTTNVRFLGDPMMYMFHSVVRMAQDVLQKKLTEKTWFDLLDEESKDLPSEFVWSFSESPTAKQLHTDSHKNLISQRNDLKQTHGNPFGRKLSSADLERFNQPIPQEVIDYLKKEAGIDEYTFKSFIERILPSLRRGESTEFSTIIGALTATPLTAQEVDAVYDAWSAKKLLCPSLVFHSLIQKKPGRSKSGDFSDEKHIVMLEFVDYLVTDKANVNYLKSQLPSNEWSMYTTKLLSDNEIGNVFAGDVGNAAGQTG